MEVFVDELCFITAVMAAVSAVMIVFRRLWLKGKNMTRERERIAVTYTIFLSVFLGALVVTLVLPVCHLIGYALLNNGIFYFYGARMTLPYVLSDDITILIFGCLIFLWLYGFLRCVLRDRTDLKENGYARLEGYNEIINSGEVYSLYEMILADMEITKAPFLMVNPTIRSARAAYSKELGSMCVLLPKMYCQERELRIMLAHELAHIKRRDIPVRYMFYFLGEIYWFLGLRDSLKNDLFDLQETLADKMAIRQFSDVSEQTYYSIVIDTAARMAVLPERSPFAVQDEKVLSVPAREEKNQSLFIRSMEFILGKILRKGRGGDEAPQLERRIMNMLRDANSRKSSGSVTMPAALTGILILSLFLGIWCFPTKRYTAMVAAVPFLQAAEETEEAMTSDPLNDPDLFYMKKGNGEAVFLKSGSNADLFLEAGETMESPFLLEEAGTEFILQAFSDDGPFEISLLYDGMTEGKSVPRGELGTLDFVMEEIQYRVTLRNTGTSAIHIRAYLIY